MDLLTGTPTQREVADFVSANKLTRPSATYSTIRIVAFLAAWPLLFLLGGYLRNPFAWLVILVAEGFVFEGFSSGIHESGHDKLYTSRRLNYLAGIIMSVPLLHNFPAHRATHFAHHQHTHDLEKDSEPIYKEMKLYDYLAYMLFSGEGYTLILYFEGLMASVGRGPTWARSRPVRRMCRISTVIVSIELSLLALGIWRAPGLTVKLFVVPYVIWGSVLSSMVTHPEHEKCDFGPARAFTTTRTTESNRFLRYFLWYNNYHAAHHLVPSVPGQNLPALQEFIDPYCKHRERSYTRWHLAYIRTLFSHRGRDSMLTTSFWISFAKRIDVFGSK